MKKSKILLAPTPKGGTHPTVKKMLEDMRKESLLQLRKNLWLDVLDQYEERKE